MQLFTDRDLWNKLRAGDKQALRIIYDRESDYLYNYGKKIVQDSTLVEDTIHDLFIDIWSRHERLGETDRIRPYLAASLRRRMVNELKKSSKSQSVDSFDTVPFEAELAIDQIIIQGEMDRETSLKLKAAFESLTDRQKEILYLKFYQGLDYEQISEVVGIQYQSLRNTIYNCLKKLRATMMMILFLLLSIFFL